VPNDLIRSYKPEEIVVKRRQVDVTHSRYFTGHRADATKVRTLGLFNEAIPDSNLTERAKELIEAIASGAATRHPLQERQHRPRHLRRSESRQTGA